MTRGDLVVLRTYPHRIAAEIDKGTLEAAGLTVFLQAGPFGPSHEKFGVDLLVWDEDAARAREILGPN